MAAPWIPSLLFRTPFVLQESKRSNGKEVQKKANRSDELCTLVTNRNAVPALASFFHDLSITTICNFIHSMCLMVPSQRCTKSLSRTLFCVILCSIRTAESLIIFKQLKLALNCVLSFFTLHYTPNTILSHYTL